MSCFYSFKFEIISTRIGQVIKLWNNLQFFWNILYIKNLYFAFCDIPFWKFANAIIKLMFYFFVWLICFVTYWFYSIYFSCFYNIPKKRLILIFKGLLVLYKRIHKNHLSTENWILDNIEDFSVLTSKRTGFFWVGG